MRIFEWKHPTAGRRFIHYIIQLDDHEHDIYLHYDHTFSTERRVERPVDPAHWQLVWGDEAKE